MTVSTAVVSEAALRETERHKQLFLSAYGHFYTRIVLKSKKYLAHC